jgi:acetyltransferase-like isoleucine patch superfamily enzyme
MISPLFSPQELRDLGIGSLGSNVRIDRTCRFYGAERIVIGSHVRIDAYSILSAGHGGIRIGDYIHLSAGVTIVGGGSVTLEDFVGISARVTVFSANDDYSGAFLTGPMVPDSLRNATVAPVLFQKHALVGAGCVILPGVTIGVGSAVGALSLVKRSVDDFAIVAGSPSRRVGTRSRAILDLEARLRDSVAA